MIGLFRSKHKTKSEIIEELRWEINILETMVEGYRMIDHKNMLYIEQLKKALKAATAEPEVDYWKIALDDDIDKYILKEGEDERN